ncbi:S9 family peptidase [Hymenobacter sp. GOD-10R]|uniref:S9 family peptidase n=1 Tax=Hymenobacter sp. GOD-10R TaxID=3093922 RepID=UPI002D76CEA9|nr:DPP IV N-terminal domain-containing protein [Hymenobacter sp. GOD-10R]WRQ29115.1 DPP IV N-terminal domain-containing protein [Hymenobacter sp. GOD-10R]
MAFSTLARAAYLLTLTLSVLHTEPSSAQGGQLADYQRSNALHKQLYRTAYHIPTQVSWQPDSKAVYYAMYTPKGQEFWQAAQGSTAPQPAFEPSPLASKLSAALKQPVTPYQLPLSNVRFTTTSAGLLVNFTAGPAEWEYAPATTMLRQTRKLPEARYWNQRDDHDEAGKLVYSPDSVWVAFVKDYNVYLRSVKTKEETPLSFDGSAGDYYSSELQWAPDSKKLVGVRIRRNTPHTLYLVRSSPTDQLQPKLETRPYLKPGDALPLHQPSLFLVAEKKQMQLPLTLFAQQYNISRPTWRKDSHAFTFEYNERGHQLYRVLEADATTGQVRTLIEERSPTFISYSGKLFRHDVADGKEIIWMSERDGWNHLYRYDGRMGKVKNQITKGPWVVRQVVHVDEAKRTILFAASGRDAGQDPYLLHYYSIDFDGKHLTDLTPENANHAATFSPDYQRFVDVYSRVDLPSVTVLRDAANGKVLQTLERADLSAWQQAHWQTPEVFSAKGRDGKTDIWGIIVRPTNFDPARKYPVIENIYAGPHDSFVPKSFMNNNLGMHELAELGFVVVQIDGMGTSNRSKAFHDVCWKNLKDAGFPDRIKWLEAAAQRYPALDLTRVGIYGTSAGGQSAAGALLFHPEFYKVGVASCGCHDNRMDKMWWNEQWMGYPIGPQYAECSNVTHADQLRGRLLLLVGEMDDNVDPSSTYQFADALIKANKDFELVMLPNLGHTTGGEFGERKRRDFFVRHLLHQSPPEWSELPTP